MVKILKDIYSTAIIMPYIYSRDQNKHVEKLVNTLASTEAELHQKYYTPKCLHKKGKKPEKSR